MNGFKKIFPIFLSHYATFFAKMAEKKVIPLDEFHYQSKLMYPSQKHPVYNIPRDRYIAGNFFEQS
jgi:Leu/Phe-tRNA-protein transferase